MLVKYRSVYIYIWYPCVTGTAFISFGKVVAEFMYLQAIFRQQKFLVIKLLHYGKMPYAYPVSQSAKKKNACAPLDKHISIICDEINSSLKFYYRFVNADIFCSFKIFREL